MRNLKAFILFLLTLLMPFMAYAYSDYIYAGGDAIGIQIKSNGVLVVGSYDVGGKSLIKDAKLQIGDMIVSVDDKRISSSTDFISSIKNKDSVKIGYVRGDKELSTTLKIVKEGSIYKSGLYVKDNITGIGTLTFIDPESKNFGALGHEIIEKTTGKLFDANSGTIFDSVVTGIQVSKNGIPGAKNAKYDMDEVIGNVFENTNKGIFGEYTGDVSDKKLYEVGDFDDIKTGAASILTVVKGTEISEYDITINKITNGDIKNILFEITDKDLLNTSGGIVQGMSGSPIIQDGKIIGAVTHVVIDNPVKGYGIYIGTMLEETEN